MGQDPGKKVEATRFIYYTLVDTKGLPLRVVVHSAAVQDFKTAASGLGPRQILPEIRLARVHLGTIPATMPIK